MSIREYFGFEPRKELTVPVVETRATPDGEPSPGILPPPRNSLGVTPTQASEIGTVYRAVNTISTVLSTLPIEVIRNGKKIKTPLFIQNPIDGESQSSFIQQVVWSLALWGNCYVKVNGTPAYGVEVLDPDSVTVTKDPETGKVAYFIGPKSIPADRIRHLKFERLPGKLLGIGPMHGCKGEIKAAYLLDKFQATWFDTTGIPKGVIQSPGKLDPETSKMFVKDWNEFVKGNSGTSILPNGMDYKTIEYKPIELQYKDVAEANIRNIARIFGIPADILLSSMTGTSMTYTNAIESNIRFRTFTLARYMDEIENFLSGLLPTNQRAKFNEEELERLSPESLWNIKKVQYDVGYYDGAEQRKQEGLPPLPKKEVSKPEAVEPNKANSVKENDEQNGN